MTPTSVIRSYFAISGVYTLSASMIWGVNTLFLLDAGLDIFGVFIAGAAFTAGNVVFELPTGVVADTVGRRASFLCSAAILCVGTLAYVAIPLTDLDPLVWFTAASVLLGLGFTFYSGAVESWLVDALHASGYGGNLDSVFSRGAMVSGAAMLIGTVGGGFLGQLDLSLPFFVRSGLLVLAFALAFVTMHDLGFERRSLALKTLRTEMAAVSHAGITFGWGQQSLRLLMLASAVHTGVMFYGFYAWQPYFQELLGTDTVWFAGLVAAGIALSTMIGNTVVDYFARLCGKRTTLLIWASVVYAVAAVGIGLAPNFWLALTCLLIVTGTMGVIGPVRQAYIHQMAPAQQRATVVSFDSMIANVGGIGGQTGLGYLSKVQDFPTAYIVGGASAVVAVPLLFLLRGLGEDADRIIGKAGARSPCAAQGLAAAGAIDDRAY